MKNYSVIIKAFIFIEGHFDSLVSFDLKGSFPTSQFIQSMRPLVLDTTNKHCNVHTPLTDRYYYGL